MSKERTGRGRRDTVARVYRELWLSPVSIPRLSSGGAPTCPQRSSRGERIRRGNQRGERVASEKAEGRGGERGRHEEEDRNLLGSECNFIVNLSLSEGKQWSDLRTICPCHLYLHLA